MVKSLNSSPQKRVDLVSECEATAARLVTIASPRTGISPKKQAGPQRDDLFNSMTKGSSQKEMLQHVGSPLKDSLRKAPREWESNDSSPRKKMLTSVDFPFSCRSPKKNKLASPHKNLTGSEIDYLKVSVTKPRSPKKREIAKVPGLSDKKDALLSIPPIPAFDPLAEVQNVLRTRISQINSPSSIYGYERERKQLHELIKRTATTGESNSILLVGPRGCGKSMLLRDVIERLFCGEKIKQNLLRVQLNGLLQTDDRIALREITRQLELENTVGDKVFGSFAETLQFLLEALKKGDRSSKSILFVLEEFDLFAQHKNQTLLYNLFDISQSAQAPVCIIGVTCRLDVIELLEKRVKSRFSHRQLYLFNKLTLEQYRALCRDYLSLPHTFPDAQFATEWNSNIKSLLDEVAVKDVLERQFSLMNDVRGLLSLLTYPVCSINESHPTISASDLITSFKLISTDTKSAMLHGVSILELAIIIAMKHLTDIYEGEPFNFEMVYSEYLKYARHRSGMQVYEKAIVMKAFEHLQSLELIRGHGSGGTSQKEYRLMDLLVHPAQIMDALQKYPNCPTEMKQWASQSIA